MISRSRRACVRRTREIEKKRERERENLSEIHIRVTFKSRSPLRDRCYLATKILSLAREKVIDRSRDRDRDYAEKRECSFLLLSRSASTSALKYYYARQFVRSRAQRRETECEKAEGEIARAQRVYWRKYREERNRRGER